jgi:hypothetical protein
MNKTRNYLIVILLILSAITAAAVSQKSEHTPDADEISFRQSLTQLTGLPDISVYTESKDIRHRSLTDISSQFSPDPFSPDGTMGSIVYKRVGR